MVRWAAQAALRRNEPGVEDAEGLADAESRRLCTDQCPLPMIGDLDGRGPPDVPHTYKPLEMSQGASNKVLWKRHLPMSSVAIGPPDPEWRAELPRSFKAFTCQLVRTQKDILLSNDPHSHPHP